MAKILISFLIIALKWPHLNNNPTTAVTTCPCENDFKSMREHISVLNTEITPMRSFVLE